MFADDTIAAGPIADFVPIGVPIIPEVIIPGKELVFAVELDLLQSGELVQAPPPPPPPTNAGAGFAAGVATVVGVGTGASAGQAAGLSTGAATVTGVGSGTTSGETIITGWITAAQGSSINDGGQAGWTNPTRITLSDDSRSNSARSTPGTSHWLYASDFALDIPDNVPIRQIDVQVERSTPTTPVGRVRDHTIQLTKDGTTLVGVNKASAVDWVASAADDQVVTYTFSPDEAGNPTFAEVKSAFFGVVVKVQWLDSTGTGLIARVDAVNMRVHYGGPQPATQGAGTAAGTSTVTGVPGGNVTATGTAAGRATISGFGTTIGSQPGLPPGNWQLIWNDEFDLANGAPPRSHWFNGPSQPPGNWRHGVVSDADVFHDGNSNIVLRVRCVNGQGHAPYLCTNSTGVQPQHAGHTLFGPNGWTINGVTTNPAGQNGIYIEWRANVSDFRPGGAWAALWMHTTYGEAYTGDPATGSEIDVMEYTPFVNPNNGNRTLMTNFNSAVFWGHDAGQNSRPDPRRTDTLQRFGINLEDDAFHTWSLEWYNDRQVYRFDGNVYWTNTVGVSTAETHGVRITIECLENAFGLNSGTVCAPNTAAELEPPPQHFRVDYVRIYRKLS